MLFQTPKESLTLPKDMISDIHRCSKAIKSKKLDLSPSRSHHSHHSSSKKETSPNRSYSKKERKRQEKAEEEEAVNKGKFVFICETFSKGLTRPLHLAQVKNYVIFDKHRGRVFCVSTKLDEL